MGDWAERMIIKEVQEESRIKQEEVVSRNKVAKEKKHEASVLAMRLFSYRHIDSEWFWRIIAYTYFICKTLGLLILIDIFIFRRPNAILFIFIFLCCYYFNLKLYKYISGKKTKGLSKKTHYCSA